MKLIKKLLNKADGEGSKRHLLSALQALADGNDKDAESNLAAYLLVEQALDGPLNWISHDEYLSGDDAKVIGNKVIGVVEYRNESHEIKIDLD